MRHRLSYLGNVVLATALVVTLFFVRNPFDTSAAREAAEHRRKLAEQQAEWQAQQQARDEEFRRQQAASRARIEALQAEAAKLEREINGK